MSHNFKYADLLNDDVFKLVFGRESKGSVYDMFCKTDDGSRIIVEVQRRKQPFYPERALYYSTFQIQRQLEAGAEDYDFLPVYVVNILDFMMDGCSDCRKVKTIYRLYEEDTHSLLTDRVTFIFIELPKFTKKIDDLDGNILEGMYFCLKNMVNLRKRPEVLGHKVFKKIFEVSELLEMDEETRKKVIDSMTTERDLRNQMAYARKTAIEEGRAEGREKGRAEGRADAASKMLAAGIPAQVIADALGITVEECESYRTLNQK